MILVLVETTADGLSTLSAQALTFARSTGQPLHAVAVGPVGASTLDQLGSHAVEVVHVVSGPGLTTADGFAPAAWAAAVQHVVGAEPPALLVAAGSPRGTEVLAHVAARATLPMAAGVVELRPVDGGSGWTATRQLMGGSVLEELTLASPTHVVTVAPHSVAAVEAGTPTTPQVHEVPIEAAAADLVARVVTVEPAADGGGALADARVVVGGGRGVGGADAFGPLVELAELLHGSLGVSRVVTSQGWRPHHEQVGQTGTRIAPDLYVACGISGAIQHMAGCQSAKTILAINTDADAPMVTRAHFAVVGDLHEVVPAITDELRRRLA